MTEIMRARRRAYDNFIESSRHLLRKEPRSVLKVAEIAWAKLQDVKAEAWTKLQDAVVDLWETWPRNLIRAIRQTILDANDQNVRGSRKNRLPILRWRRLLHRAEGRRAVMGAIVTYSFAWRCAGCKNWVRGIRGKGSCRIPPRTQNRGFEIVIQPKPTISEKRARRSR